MRELWIRNLALPLMFVTGLACEGPPGSTGQQGTQGTPGTDGVQGEQGDPGPAGSVGAQGPQGEVGEQGPEGPQGPSGPQGPTAYIPRDGFALEVIDASVAAGEVTITVRALDDRGEPLPVAEIERIRVGLARLVTRGQGATFDRWSAYVSCPAAAPHADTLQPCFEPVVDAGSLTAGATVENDRSITYRFSTDISTGFNGNVLHRFSVEGRRTFNGTRRVDEVQFDLVPSGGQASSRQLVTQDACNGCHTNLSFHGGNRSDVEACVTCHTAELIDPDSGENLEFGRLVHKIHRGAGLPSVLAGTPFVIYGFGGAAEDFSTVAFPRDIRDCESCHVGSDRMRYATNPTRDVCGGCHDRTWYGPLASTPAGYAAHVGTPQADDARCTGCHPDREGFAGVIDKHLLPQNQPTATTFAAQISSVVAAAGQRPVVEFSLSDRNGTPVETVSTVTRLAVTAAGPTSNYTTSMQETAVGTGARGLEILGGGQYRFTFTASVAADATGTWGFSIEGYRTAGLPDGTTFRHGAVNPISYLDLEGGSPDPRRVVVSNAKCDACHGEVAAHGNNRVGEVQYCVMCHRPGATDQAVRPSGMPESIDFRVLIHKIHQGHQLPSVAAGTPYVVYGRGGQAHDYSEVRFPTETSRCATCHESDTEVQPSAAACTSCHDGSATKAHAELNTTAEGAEACAVCHGPNRDRSVVASHTY